MSSENQVKPPAEAVEAESAEAFQNEEL